MKNAFEYEEEIANLKAQLAEQRRGEPVAWVRDDGGDAWTDAKKRDERAEFEAWLLDEPGVVARHLRMVNGAYTDRQVRLLWYVWQSSRSLLERKP